MEQEGFCEGHNLGYFSMLEDVASLRAVLIISFCISRNLKFFENVSATVTQFELNFIHSKSVTVSLICDHIVSWSNMDLQWQQAGKDHVCIPPEYNDGLDIKQAT